MKAKMYFQIKKNIVGLQICLISIVLFFPACNRRAIIWRDYSSLENLDNIELMYGADNHYDIKEYKLTPKKSKYIYIPYNYSYVSHGHQSDIAFHIYAPVIIGRDKIELFIFDRIKFREYSDKFIVDKKDDVVAYFITYFDTALDKVCTIVSKDNILYKKKGLYDRHETIYDILKIIENEDYLDDKDFLESYTFNKPYNGYIVQSKIDNSYIWLSTMAGSLF